MFQKQSKLTSVSTECAQMPPTDILVVLDAPADLGEEVDTDKALNNAKQWLSDFASNFVLSDQETRVINPELLTG